jgi:hypothetical protein
MSPVSVDDLKYIGGEHWEDKAFCASYGLDIISSKRDILQRVKFIRTMFNTLSTESFYIYLSHYNHQKMLDDFYEVIEGMRENSNPIIYTLKDHIRRYYHVYAFDPAADGSWLILV